MSEKNLTIEEAYDRGYTHGLVTYAHWKDGIQLVGTAGTTLKYAIETRKKSYMYDIKMRKYDAK